MHSSITENTALYMIPRLIETVPELNERVTYASMHLKGSGFLLNSMFAFLTLVAFLTHYTCFLQMSVSDPPDIIPVPKPRSRYLRGAGVGRRSSSDR